MPRRGRARPPRASDVGMRMGAPGSARSTGGCAAAREAPKLLITPKSSVCARRSRACRGEALSFGTDGGLIRDPRRSRRSGRAWSAARYAAMRISYSCCLDGQADRARAHDDNVVVELAMGQLSRGNRPADPRGQAERAAIGTSSRCSWTRSRGPRGGTKECAWERGCFGDRGGHGDRARRRYRRRSHLRTPDRLGAACVGPGSSSWG